MKKTLLVLTVLISFAAMSFKLTRQEDPIFKNLKVLPKNITKDQMDSVMKSYAAALDVKCNFCHVRKTDSLKTWDYASDGNKHKLVARQMITMTNKINEKYFNVTGKKNLEASLMVTCYTCHNGKPEPEVKPEPVRAQREKKAGTVDHP